MWSRVDQKTCLKAITAANLVPVVIELQRAGDALVTDTEAIAAALQRLGPDSVACIVTTSSCFAPRACDDVSCAHSGRALQLCACIATLCAAPASPAPASCSSLHLAALVPAGRPARHHRCVACFCASLPSSVPR